METEDMEQMTEEGMVSHRLSRVVHLADVLSATSQSLPRETAVPKCMAADTGKELD